MCPTPRRPAKKEDFSDFVFINFSRLTNLDVVAVLTLADEEHKYLCKIFDGSGTLVATSQISFTPEGGSWNTWTWYNINKYVDKPGNWTFEIHLDGQKVIEENLAVLSQ